MRFCPCCVKKTKKNFKKALKQALLTKMGIKSKESDKKIDKDPFLILGKL